MGEGSRPVNDERIKGRSTASCHHRLCFWNDSTTWPVGVRDSWAVVLAIMLRALAAMRDAFHADARGIWWNGGAEAGGRTEQSTTGTGDAGRERKCSVFFSAIVGLAASIGVQFRGASVLANSNNSAKAVMKSGRGETKQVLTRQIHRVGSRKACRVDRVTKT